MIKVVFFDFDGVLTLEATGADAICDVLAMQTGIPRDKLIKIYRTYLWQLLLGDKDYASILKPLNDELKTQLTIDDINEAAKAAKPNQAMFQLAQELRDKGLMTGVITDNNIERIEILHQPFGLNDFTPVIVSGAIGCGKWQSTKIFEIALQQAGLRPEESFFIDNSKDNLTFADQLGMQTYWHDDAANDVAALRNYLAQLEIKL